MKLRNILLAAAIGGIVALAAIWLPAGPVRAQDMTLYEDDRILGSAEAPITIIEYSSLTCPHCAAFHADALPKIKETWIADGRARLVYRHFPLDGMALIAASAAECLTGERYFGFLEFLFRSQRKWATPEFSLQVKQSFQDDIPITCKDASGAPSPASQLCQIARLAGMSQEKFEACANDEDEMARILSRRQDGIREFDVQSTPTLIVNWNKVSGARSFEHFEKIFKKIVPDS